MNFRLFRGLICLLLLAFLSLTAVPLPAADESSPAALSNVLPEDASLDGNWHGTWIYVSREHRFALWVQMQGDHVEVRLRYQSMGSGESFQTDWNGQATYVVNRGNGTFSFDITKSDENLLFGDWFWRLEYPNSSRTETSPIRMYRIADGRMLRIEFPEFERTLVKRDKRTHSKVNHSWSFRKISRRILLWDELPF